MKRPAYSKNPSSPIEARETRPPTSYKRPTNKKGRSASTGGSSASGGSSSSGEPPGPPPPPRDPPATTAPDTPRELGVRDPRPPARPVQPLADPRRAASRDLIDVQRRSLWKARGNEPSPWLTTNERVDPSQVSETETAFSQLIGARTDDPIPTVLKLSPQVVAQAVKNALTADQAANLTTLPYRYTKGVETVNDELGYGERITESFCRISNGKLQTRVRISQLTKSGRQQLRPLCKPGAHDT